MSNDVEVAIEVEAAPETVWRYLVDPERFSRWLGARVEMEPRVGGALRIHFDKFGTVVAGSVVELSPPRRAVFTWGVESGPQAQSMPAGSTRVVVTLEPKGSGTHVTLRHEELPDEKEARDHEGGWRYYAGQLERVLREERLGAAVEALADSFAEAWNVEDAGRRASLLADCFDDDGRFEDLHVAVAGRSGLAEHVATARTLMPGFRVERAGGVQLVREWARWGFAIRDASGGTLATGTNVARLSAGPRLAHVVGFWDAR